VRPKGEVLHRSFNDPDGEESLRIDVSKHSQVILELAKHVEGAGGNTYREDGGARFDQRTPRLLVGAIGTEIEAIGNNCITTRTQNEKKIFPQWCQAGSVVHQCGLK